MSIFYETLAISVPELASYRNDRSSTFNTVIIIAALRTTGYMPESSPIESTSILQLIFNYQLKLHFAT